MTGKDQRGALSVTARVVLRFADRASAERARASLAPESKGFLEMSVEGERLVLEVPAGGVGRVLATVDDVLSCLQVALEASKVVEDTLRD